MQRELERLRGRVDGKEDGGIGSCDEGDEDEIPMPEEEVIPPD